MPLNKFSLKTMPFDTRTIKRRQTMIQNIIDITSSLETISAIRMKKAQNIVKSGAKFIETAFKTLTAIFDHLKESGDLFINKNKNESYAPENPIVPTFLVISSDKGLCGSYNVNVFNGFMEFIQKANLDIRKIQIITVGKYAFNYFKKRGCQIMQHFEKFHNVLEYDDIEPIYQKVLSAYNAGDINDLYAVYTDFISTLKNRVVVRKLLPLNLDDIVAIIKEINPNIEKEAPAPSVKKIYLFEPNPKELFNNLVPFLFLIKFCYFISESNASEHSLRMIAMKSARDNAADFLKNLTLLYNKMRQEKITNEVIEITSTEGSMIDTQ